MIYAIQRFMPQTFNDFMAIFITLGIFAIWIIQGCGKLSLPTEVTGALIVTWTLVVQFYFRRSKKEDKI